MTSAEKARAGNILNRELMQDLGGEVERKKPIPFDMVKEGKVGIQPCALLLLTSRLAKYMFLQQSARGMKVHLQVNSAGLTTCFLSQKVGSIYLSFAACV